MSDVGSETAFATASLKNPVRLLLDAQAPGYWEWFVRWRELRNRLKDGISVMLQGSPDGIGITFTVTTGDHQGRHEVRLEHATEALCFSTAVTEAAIARLNSVYR
ncbi:MAG: hypothetical protein ACYDA3_00120 [Gaiellaceae bacterium]